MFCSNTSFETMISNDSVKWNVLWNSVKNNNDNLNTINQCINRLIGILQKPKPNNAIMNMFRKHCKQKYIRHSTQLKKKVLQVYELDNKALQIYKQILHLCPSDKAILQIHNLIHNLAKTKKISGRMVDILMTVYPKIYNSSYYLDISNPSKVEIVSYINENVILFDIGSAYKRKMNQYSKSYFDCFGRGAGVLHKLNSGKNISIHICQFIFFIWADRFKIFEYLSSKRDVITELRYITPHQTNTHKCQNIICSSLYPIIRIKYNKVNDRVFLNSNINKKKRKWNNQKFINLTYYQK